MPNFAPADCHEIFKQGMVFHFFHFFHIGESVCKSKMKNIRFTRTREKNEKNGKWKKIIDYLHAYGCDKINNK